MTTSERKIMSNILIAKLKLARARRDFAETLMEHLYAPLTEDSPIRDLMVYGRVADVYLKRQALVENLERKLKKQEREK